MSDSENELPEPSPTPINLPPQPRIGLAEVRATHEMLVGFREGVREGSYQGKYLKHIAMGLEFLENMVLQSANQLEQAKKAQKEAAKQALGAIKANGGEVLNGSKPETVH